MRRSERHDVAGNPLSAFLQSGVISALMKWSDMSSNVWIADGPVSEVAAAAPVDNPARYKAAMQIFLKAGSRILRASTPQGVALCKQIVSQGDQVWAVAGPSGKILAIREIEEAELKADYEQTVCRLASAEPDVFLIQSFTDVEEAILFLQVAKEACKLKVGVSLVFGSGPDQTDTIMGQACEDATRRLVDAGADLIGCNCGISVDEMVLIVRLMRQITDLPIIACPDAGQRELDGEAIVYRELPEDFASKAASLAQAGANIIGGCCGITAEHIKCLAETLGAPPEA